jgi:ABC-type glycerol-3-phosphate transport system substrate-binding protein
MMPEKGYALAEVIHRRLYLAWVVRTARGFGACAAIALVSCGQRADILTVSGSALGAEGAVLRRQIDRFSANHANLPIEIRSAPDAADQRHQLYVQWLNAWASDPDVLQLDVIWTPEFAAAGWILPLDQFNPLTSDFFDAPIAANRWNGRLYAMPWFVDTGMLYWRTDLLAAPPNTFDALVMASRRAMADGAIRNGFVWQGARYEGLVTVFLEHLVGFGGRILDDDGKVVVDSPAAVRALSFMASSIHEVGIVPSSVLAWQEEQTRFAFQNGHALFMRNWPYAAALMRDPGSSVAGRVAMAPMPHDGGSSAAALGGAQLAINARSRQPDAAWRLVEYLTGSEQMLERAQVAGQFPARRSLYAGSQLATALPMAPDDARQLIERAVPRPITPVYTQLSGILQVHLHRALTEQEEPQAALERAAADIRTLLAKTGLAPGES